MNSSSTNDWATTQLQRIEELSKDLSISKFNLLKISYMERIVEETSRNMGGCEKCKSNSLLLTSMIEEIPNLELIDHRQPYEKKFNKIRTHFHKSHGFIPPYKFTARYTLIAMVLGLIIGLTIFFTKENQIIFDTIFLCSTIGLFVGYFVGAIQEIKFRKTRKII